MDYMVMSNYYLVVICTECDAQYGELHIYNYRGGNLKLIHTVYGSRGNVIIDKYAYIREGGMQTTIYVASHSITDSVYSSIGQQNYYISIIRVIDNDGIFSLSVDYNILEELTPILKET